MTLDDIERLARMHEHLTDPSDPWPAEIVGDLARILLAVLPVVKAAEAWSSDPTKVPPADCGRCTECLLRTALSHLHATTEGR